MSMRNPTRPLNPMIDSPAQPNHYWYHPRHDHCSACGAEDNFTMEGPDKRCLGCGAINSYYPYVDKRTGLGVPTHIAEGRETR